MTVVCGIDVGSFRSPSYVAWLQNREFLLDLRLLSPEAPLPDPPPGWKRPSWIALDAPQGLPKPGRRVRQADREAGTPTRTLPGSRQELAGWRIYRPFITAGVEIFWSVHERELASILGLVPLPDEGCTVCETYPRYILRRLWPDLPIPSKTREPWAYVEAVWERLTRKGYRCPSVLRPTVDQADAMLCALAAEACLLSPSLPEGTVGEPPFVDSQGRVLREGFIVSP